MSTRANIIIKDKYDELIFYRHNDGYPEGTLPTLRKFLKYVKNGLIRDNICQASGWLILIGAEDNNTYLDGFEIKKKPTVTKPMKLDSMSWKCGAYEPTTQIHMDIEYLYVIDLEQKKIFIEGDKTKFRYQGKYRQ